VEDKELFDIFQAAVSNGAKQEQARKGMAAIANLVACFYDALKNTALPRHIVSELTNTFCATFITMTMGPVISKKREEDANDG